MLFLLDAVPAVIILQMIPDIMRVRNKLLYIHVGRITRRVIKRKSRIRIVHCCADNRRLHDAIGLHGSFIIPYVLIIPVAAGIRLCGSRCRGAENTFIRAEEISGDRRLRRI